MQRIRCYYYIYITLRAVYILSAYISSQTFHVYYVLIFVPISKKKMKIIKTLGTFYNFVIALSIHIQCSSTL